MVDPDSKPRIRPMQDKDLEQVLEWRNHPQVRQVMFTQHKISMQEHQKWFSRVRHEDGRQILIYEEGDQPMGFVHFTNAVAGGIADWGFYASPDALKGVGRRMGELALAYAFEQLDIHKVCGQALDFNAASIGLHQRLGFQQEGVLRHQKQIEGRYCDLICFGLLKDEWQQHVCGTAGNTDPRS